MTGSAGRHSAVRPILVYRDAQYPRFILPRDMQGKPLSFCGTLPSGMNGPPSVQVSAKSVLLQYMEIEGISVFSADIVKSLLDLTAQYSLPVELPN